MSEKNGKVVGDSDEAARRLSEALSDEAIDNLLADAESSGTPVDGVDGLLNRLTSRVLERALETELADHLGYEHGDPAGRGSGNSRNGHSSKKVATTAGPVDIRVPRDRNSTFEPQIVRKHARRIGSIEDMILSLYARGLSTREIEAHLKEVYGIDASPALVSKITDVVVDEITAWQNRPVDEVYPIVYVDAIRIRVRDRGSVTLKSAHLVVGVDTDGCKDVLGIWIAAEEGAKFWAHVLTQLRNRGLRDILILCCDGLTGLPDAVRGVFENTIVQTCVVHVIRNTMRFVSYSDRKKIAASMRTIYTSASPEEAEVALKEFNEQFGQQYPGAIEVWRKAWHEFIPFLDYPPELRRIVYTTNMIESINYQLRKITKTRGHFPDDEAAMKLLYLGIRNLSRKRGGESGTGTQGWKKALNFMVIEFPGRLT